MPPVAAVRPPQTTMYAPVQTAVWFVRAAGTPGPVEVGVQVLVAGAYLPPVSVAPPSVSPPQTIMSVPVQTAECFARPSGTP